MVAGLFGDQGDSGMSNAALGSDGVELHATGITRAYDTKAIPAHCFIGHDGRQRDESAAFGSHHFHQGQVFKLRHYARLEEFQAE